MYCFCVRTVGGFWVELSVVGDGRECDDSVNENRQKENGRDESPANSPVSANFDAQHELDVAAEVIQSCKNKNTLVPLPRAT